MTTGVIDSPVGPLLVTMSDHGVQSVQFAGTDQAPLDLPLTGEIAEQLAGYFAGQVRTFALLVDLSGISEFTRKVLEATAMIPYGETVSYGEIARRIDMPECDGSLFDTRSGDLARDVSAFLDR